MKHPPAIGFGVPLPGVSRREFLKLAGLAGTAAFLSACGASQSVPTPGSGDNVQLVYQDWRTPWFPPMASSRCLVSSTTVIQTSECSIHRIRIKAWQTSCWQICRPGPRLMFSRAAVPISLSGRRRDFSSTSGHSSRPTLTRQQSTIGTLPSTGRSSPKMGFSTACPSITAP